MSESGIDLSWYRHENYQYLESCSKQELYQQLSRRARLINLEGAVYSSDKIKASFLDEMKPILEQIKSTGRLLDSDDDLLNYFWESSLSTPLIAPASVSGVEEMNDYANMARSTMLRQSEEAKLELSGKYDSFKFFYQNVTNGLPEGYSCSEDELRESHQELLKEQAAITESGICTMPYDVAMFNVGRGISKEDTRVHLSIDLDATNQDIIKELKVFLNKYRQEVAIYPPEPQNLTVTKIVNDRVIPYIDLMIWDRLEGNGVLGDADGVLSDTLAAQVLFSWNDGVREVRGPDKVRRTTKANARKALSVTFLNRLYSEAYLEGVDKA